MRKNNFVKAGLVVIVLVILIAAGCKKPAHNNTAPAPQPECATAWVGLADTGYVTFALKNNVRLAAIFEYNGTQTADINKWLAFFELAQQRGAKLRICPIPVTDSAYLDDRNAAKQMAVVSNFMQVLQTAGIKPCEIILDIEGMNASKYCQALIQCALGNAAAQDTLLANALSKAGRDSAIAVYQAFVNQCHSTGWKVGATTLNQVAIEDVNDITIERVLGIPITGINWDFVTYQAYRTSTFPVFASLGNPTPSSYFVYKFAKQAQLHYGVNGGLDIGIMGVSTDPNAGYPTFDGWQNDVDATRAAGLNPDLVAGFRMECANTPVPGDSALFFSQFESSPAPAVPADNYPTDDYFTLYQGADARLGPLLPQ